MPSGQSQPQRTFGVLFDKVCRLDVLWFAWEQVRRNRGAAGVDGETIESIEARGTLWFLLELRGTGAATIPAPTGAPGVHPQARRAAKTAGIPRSEGSGRAGSGEDRN